MQVFLNECSFHEQFFERRNLERAFRIFLRVLNNLLSSSIELRFYCDRALPYKPFTREVMHASLNHLPDKSLKIAIYDALYNRLNMLNWRTEQVHSDHDMFVCEDDVITSTGIAEFAERKLRSDDLVGLLFNFPLSKYSGKQQLSVIKNEREERLLDCADNNIEVARWLNDHYPPASIPYDYESDARPTDHQTLLCDLTRFDRTGQVEGGRQVYREKESGRYWYVDNLHKGHGAHLEVFDTQGKHLGEATLEGVIDYDKKDSNKHIDI